MRSLAFLGLVAAMAVTPGAVQAQSDSAGIAIAAGAVQNAAGAWRGGMRGWRGGNRWNNRGWRGGNRRFVRRGNFRRGFRGGGGGYFIGGYLPRYFLAPRYYVANYGQYGLAQPSTGSRWIRYYDDAYMVDGRGYIQDYRQGVPYGGGGGYYQGGGYQGGGYQGGGYYQGGSQRYDDRRYYDDRRGSGGNAAAGAIVGGVIGGIAGNRIAGRGNRTEGTIIGGALGAIAGGVIGSEAGRSNRSDGRRYDERRFGRRQGGYSQEYRLPDGPVPEYVGNGDFYPPNTPPMEYSAAYDYRADELSVRHQPPVYQPAPPVYQYPPQVRYVPPVRTDVQFSGGGIQAVPYSNGFAQNATTTIILNSAPAVTTTTTFIEEEVEYVAPRRRARRTVRRRPAPRRTCQVRCQCVCR